MGIGDSPVVARMKKLFILFLLLLTPVLVFVFLKWFGENRYDIPIFHEYGMGESIECADLIPADPGGLAGYPGKIVVFGFLTGAHSDVKVNHLSRIVNYFNSDEIVVLSVSTGKDSAGSPPILTDARLDNWKYINPEDKLGYILECGLGLPNEEASMDKFVLVDKERRIRGYYEALDREEVDRLMVEIRILLDNYAKDGKNSR